MSAVTTSFRSTAARVMVFTIFGLLGGLPAFVLIYAGFNGEMQLGGFIAGSLLALNFVFFASMFFLDTSELILDDNGIARKILGRVCMPIPWRGIKVIREQFLVNQRRGGKIRIDILPAAASDFALRITIKFSEQVEDFDQLIDILNRRIKQHSIRVEVLSNGLWKPRSELVATVES